MCVFIRYSSSFVSEPTFIAVNNYLSEITHRQIKSNKILSVLSPIKNIHNGKNNTAVLMYRDNHVTIERYTIEDSSCTCVTVTTIMQLLINMEGKRDVWKREEEKCVT